MPDPVSSVLVSFYSGRALGPWFALNSRQTDSLIPEGFD